MGRVAQAKSDDGKTVINFSEYERTDGKGTDYVSQVKVNGKEVEHITSHPDGNVNITKDGVRKPF